MSFARVCSRAALGVHCPEVEVEIHLGPGLPRFTVVGLPATAVKESKDRVRSAIVNSGFPMPNGRITVNLAPADLPKHGARFDLPIAIGILAANGTLDPARLNGIEFVGELALDGGVRRTGGTLPAAMQARERERALVVPWDDAPEAAMVQGVTVYPARHLLEVCDHLAGIAALPSATPSVVPLPDRDGADLSEVRGQQRARRALEIAAAGSHHLLMVGPPGTGKTMLATRLATILPLLDEGEALDTAAVASVAHIPFDPARFRQRPFRAPHHTASAAALVGGGTRPRPGEISLAHNGVLFLDELPEFDRRVIEALREPLERHAITISRAEFKVEYPADFQLVAAMNPCPCGHHGDRSGRCRCTPDRVERYLSRVSGPLLDRLDLHVAVTRPGAPAGRMTLIADDHGRGDAAQRAGIEAGRAACAGRTARPESSTGVRTRVEAARLRQYQRQGTVNGRLPPQAVSRHAGLDASEEALLESAVERLGLSMRARERVLRVALTIADLSGEEHVRARHLTEALSYRLLDRDLTTPT